MYRLSFILVAVLMVSMGTAFAADIHDNAGTSAMAFLKITPSARAAGMGEAFSAIADDAAGIHFNPAGITHAAPIDISIMHNEWFEDVRYEFAGAVRNNGKFAYGANFIYLTSGDMERRDVSGASFGTFSAYDMAVSLTGAYQVNNSLAIGISPKFLFEKIHTEDGSAIAVDFGGQYHLPMGLRFGLSIHNLGSKFKLVEEEFDLPMIYRIGAAYARQLNFIEESAILLALDLNKPRDNDLLVNLGTEVNLKQLINLRLGYKIGYDTSDITTGVGFMVKQFRLDYAFVPYKEDLGSTHRISFGVRL